MIVLWVIAVMIIPMEERTQVSNSFFIKVKSEVTRLTQSVTAVVCFHDVCQNVFNSLILDITVQPTSVSTKASA